MLDMVLDMSKPAERSVFLQAFQNLRGKHRIIIKRDLKNRSTAQCRLYFGVYIDTFRQHLAKQGEPVTANLLHEILKAKFLHTSVFHPTTGEVLGERVRSTTELTTTEFNNYLDQIAAYLAQQFGIELPQIGQFAEPEGVCT